MKKIYFLIIPNLLFSQTLWAEEVVNPSVPAVAAVVEQSPFAHVEFITQYNYFSAHHEVNLPDENQNYLQDNLPGGVITFTGTYWFPQSRWGGRLSGAFGGATESASMTVSSGEITLAAEYKLIDSEPGDTKFNGYAGVRSWTLPLIRTMTLQGSNSSAQFVDAFAISLAGPVVGAQVSRKFDGHWALAFEAQASAVVGHSNLGTSDTSVFNASPSISHKEEVTLKRQLGDQTNLALAASIGYQNDIFQWTSSSGNISQIKTSYPMIGMGIETSDDFASTEQSHKGLGVFEEFVLATKYTYNPTSYSSSLSSVTTPAEYSLYSPISGSRELEGYGWFYNSAIGLRAVANWAGFTYNKATFSYPQFWLQLGTQFKDLAGFTLQNFYGLRAWAVPVIVGSLGNSGNVYNSVPTLVGAVDTFVLQHSIGSKWTGKLLLEVSSPLIEASQNNFVSQVQWNAMSSKAELIALRKISDYFFAGAGIGFKQDQYTYVLSSTSNSSPSAVIISSNMASLIVGSSF